MTTIERLEGGYVLDYGIGGQRTICTTTDQLFDRLLHHFEGRAKTFSRESYGRVIIEREPSSQSRNEFASALLRERTNLAKLSVQELIMSRDECLKRIMRGGSTLEAAAKLHVIAELLIKDYDKREGDL